MVYSNLLAVCLKHENNVLREEHGIVKIPFNTEYKIGIRNKSNQRAVVSVFIDGKFIGRKLVINGNSSIDLERFLDNTHKFKFIEKIDAIRQHRGDRAEDGLIRIEWQFEKIEENLNVLNDYINQYRIPPIHPPRPNIIPKNPWFDNRVYMNQTTADPISFDNSISCSNMISRSVPSPGEKMKSLSEGITATGSKSNQQFREVSVNNLETQTHTLVLKLSGFKNNNDPVYQIMTVKDRKTCNYCGKKNDYKNNFCGICGAGLPE